MIRFPRSAFSAALVAVLGLTAPFTLSAYAVPIAIVDSGTDLSHPDLVNNAWTNAGDPDDAVDNDDNGLIDDTHGWNFAEGTNKLYDKRLVGTFSPDVSKFFALQTKALRKSATPEEIKWLKDHIADEKFIAQLENFGNFVHGTHVAGIASKGVAGAEIMPLKLIASKPPSSSVVPASIAFAVKAAAASPGGDATKLKLLTLALTALGSQQGKVFAPIGAYIHDQGARVANCSFGSSVGAMTPLITTIAKAVLRRDPTPAEITQLATAMITASMKATQSAFIDAAPDTLFVIAAGNDGTDNDVLPASPANIRRSNTITVAATNESSDIASFSNYGATMVDVAAPGVAIRSCIPGNDHLELSGTSQATPAVVNAAGQAMDANPKLTPAEVREIILGTVDQKAFLQGKTVSGGMVNPVRMLAAAKLSVSMPVYQAITRAHVEVRDLSPRSAFSTGVAKGSEKDAFVLPLRSPLY